MASGRQYIDVTGEPFASSRFGLLSVANELDIADPHWQQGIMFQPLDCGAANVITGSCTSDPTSKVPTVTGVPTLEADAFTAYAWVLCGPAGILRSEYERRATLALERGEGRAVESAFWTGTVGDVTIEPHLASSDATVVVTGSSNVVRAMGFLEGELASCYGGEGVIHVPAQAVPHLADRGQIVQDGSVLRTALGTLVAVYSSNNRQGPTGSDPASLDDAWFYATGAVSYARSGILMTPFEESIDRSKNSIAQIAERTYLIKWDCCHLAAQVTLSGT